MLLNVLFLMASIAILWLGSKYLVESAGRIAASLGISELVIGLTVVAFGTSAPEFAVTVSAAIDGHPEISVGNILGSNVFNISFILGIVALVRAIHSSRQLVFRDGLFMTAVTALLFTMFHDDSITRLEGGILVALLLSYMAFLLIKKDAPEESDVPSGKAAWMDYLILPASIAAVVAGGQLLVHSASFIARAAGLSDWVIGATIVAAGTSAPEMVTSIAAAVKGRHGISAGNIIGSNIFNTLGVLGVAGLIRPMTVTGGVYITLSVLMVMMLFAVFFIRTNWKLSRLEGALLLGLGVALWAWEFAK